MKRAVCAWCPKGRPVIIYWDNTRDIIIVAPRASNDNAKPWGHPLY